MSEDTMIPSWAKYPKWYNKKIYIDKTYLLVQTKGAFVEQSALFFARPRRWWKSLFLSTIKHFYDKYLFKEEYFKDKLVWTDTDLCENEAWTYTTVHFDLKNLFSSWKIEMNMLLDSIYESFPDFVTLNWVLLLNS